MTTPILLTGATGFLGHYLVAELERRGLPYLAPARAGDPPLDLASAAGERALASLLEEHTPCCVLHAAALSRLAACDRDPELADRVNHRATAALARLAGPRLLLVSTDLVFDGRRPPYCALDPPAPLSEYGRSKARGEERALAAGARVARVALLFGRSFDGRRGATDMVRSARGPVPLFVDEFRTPLHAADAAAGLLDRALAPSGPPVLHLAGAERLSRFALGLRFLRLAAFSAVLEAVRSHDPTRPPDVSLATEWSPARPLDAALASS